MINPSRAVVALLAILLTAGLYGCSPFSDSREEANAAFAEANTAIDEHNRLFARARDTYNEVKGNIESGDRPANQREDIVRAGEDLQEARGHLRDAREDLSSIPDMDIEEPVREYAWTFSGAVERQLAAETRELEFYRLLQEDPSLDGNREEALNLLDEVGGEYAAAEEEYGRAQRLANENSGIISPTDSGNTG